MKFAEPINTYLEKQNKKQRIYLYISIVVLVFILGYILYIQDALNKYEDSSYRLENAKVEDTKVQNNSGLTKIKLLQKQIKKIRKKIRDKELVASSDELYQEKRNLDVTDDNFTQFLEEFMNNAKSLHVNLEYVKIKREKLPYIGLIEVKKNLVTKGNGRFLNILKLIRSVEAQDFLIKLKYITINKVKPPKKSEKNQKILHSKNVDFRLSFEILGVTL